MASAGWELAHSSPHLAFSSSLLDHGLLVVPGTDGVATRELVDDLPCASGYQACNT